MSRPYRAPDPASVNARVLAIMADQHGLVSREQALAAGMKRHQVDDRVRAGLWVRASKGVYRHAAVLSTPHSELLACCLAHGALASHRSAAAVHRMDGYRLDRVEVVLAAGRVKCIPGARLHHSSQMDLARPVVRDGIPVTGLSRTVLDLAGVISRERLERTIDALLRDRRLRLSDLWEVLLSQARRGRNGTAALRAALEARFGEGGVPLSDWSRMVAKLLEDARLPRPAFEYRITDGAGLLVAQVDLAYPAQRLAIELDSVRWHFNLDSFVADPRRRNETSLAGWTVLTFTWDDYARRPEALCATVDRALRHAA